MAVAATNTLNTAGQTVGLHLGCRIEAGLIVLPQV
jgi:hypothetical protein